MSFDLKNVKQNKVSFTPRDAQGAVKNYAKRMREEEEERRTRQLIDDEYQRALKEQQDKRGALDRVVDGMSVLQYPAMGAITEGARAYHASSGEDALTRSLDVIGASLKGVGKGFRSANPFGKDYEEGEYQTKGMLNAITDDGWENMNGHIQSFGDIGDAFKRGDIGGALGGIAKGTAEFAGDVILDPINLIGAGAIKSVARGSGKRLGKETVKAITKETIQEAGLNKGFKLAPEVAERYARKVNKLRGTNQTVGDISFAGKTIKGSGDVLRGVGDKTVAPLINTVGDFVREMPPSKYFDSMFESRKLAKTNLDEFVAFMQFKDTGLKNALQKHGYNNRMLKEINTRFANISPDERKIMFDLLDTDKNKVLVKTKEMANEYVQKLFDDFNAVTDTTKNTHLTKRVMDNIANNIKKEGTDVFTYLSTPHNRLEETVFRKLIDPTGEYKALSYEQAYNLFKEKITVTTKRFDEVVKAPKSITEAIAQKEIVTPINELQRETGIFVNTSNLNKYSKVLKQNKAFSKAVSLNPKRKLQYLNDILFDGKQVINPSVIDNKLDGKLNGILGMVKRNAPEGEILEKLSGITNLTDKNFIDIILDDDAIIKTIKETGSVNAKIMETIVDNGDKAIRIYDGKTRELIADNLTGTFQQRTSSLADSRRLAKELKTTQLEKAIDTLNNGGTINGSDVSDVLKKQTDDIVENIRLKLDPEIANLDDAKLDEILSVTKDDYIQSRVSTSAKGSLSDLDAMSEIAEKASYEYDLVKLSQTIKKKGINNSEVMEQALKLDVVQPHTSTPGIKSLYEFGYVNRETGSYVNYVYDPYTGKLTGDPVRILNEIQLESALARGFEPGDVIDKDFIKEILDTSVADKTLSTSFKAYLESIGVATSDNYIIENGRVFVERLERKLKLDDITLSSQAKETIDFVADVFKQMGMSERQNKKLATLLNDYVPHILNPQIKNNPVLMEKLKKQDPELYRKVLMYSGEKFNMHGVARSTNLEDAVKKILTDKRTKQGLDASDITGKTVAEVNEALRPMLEKAGFDGDFFINDLYEAFVQRAVNHGEVVYAENFVDETLGQFARYVKKDAIVDKKRYYVSQKDMKKVFDGLSEEKQWVMLQEMGLDPKSRYNKMLIELNGEQLRIMKNTVEKYSGGNTIDGYEISNAVAQHLNKIGHIQQMDDMNVMLKCIDKFTNLWKQTATVINPGFHMRNYASNKFNNWLNVGSDIFNGEVRGVTKDVLGGKTGYLITKTGERISFEDIRSQLLSRDILSRVDFDNAHQARKQATTLFGGELNQGDGGVVQAILKRTGIDDPTKFNKVDPTDVGNFFVFNKGREVGSKVEDFDKTINFVANLRNGVGFDEAHEMVNKFLFDYSDLAPFEVNVMKRIIPFYTWLRKNAPLQMEMLIDQPGRYKWLFKTTEITQQQGDTTYLPEHASDWVRLPIQFNKKDFYINPNMPYQEITGLVGFDKKDAMGMLNPAIKIPYELATNTNHFFEAPIVTDSEKMPGQIGKYMQNSLLGAWNTLGRAGKGVITGDPEEIVKRTMSTATGVQPMLLDTNKQKEDAIYRAIRAMEEKNKNQTLGQKRFNQSFEEYKKTKLKKYGY